MATEREFIVNKKFLIIFITVQVIFFGSFAYALLSPKTVTVQVQKLDNSYTVQRPLDIIPPKIP